MAQPKNARGTQGGKPGEGQAGDKGGDKGGEGKEGEWANVGSCDGDSWLACKEGT